MGSPGYTCACGCTAPKVAGSQFCASCKRGDCVELTEK